MDTSVTETLLYSRNKHVYSPVQSSAFYMGLLVDLAPYITLFPQPSCYSVSWSVYFVQKRSGGGQLDERFTVALRHCETALFEPTVNMFFFLLLRPPVPPWTMCPVLRVDHMVWCKLIFLSVPASLEKLEADRLKSTIYMNRIWKIPWYDLHQMDKPVVFLGFFCFFF